MQTFILEMAQLILNKTVFKAILKNMNINPLIPKYLMNVFTIKTLVILALLAFITDSFATDSEADRKRLKGSVVDKNTQEILIGATIYVEELKTGTATDIYGNFILRLNDGSYSLKISYIGYKTSSETIDLVGDVTRIFYLEKDSRTIDDVVISAKKSDQNITRTEMSVERMEIQQIRQIPALMGEVDVIKALQLLPGVQATSEGGSGFSVRGGNYDQNLILLDEATVYNASHLMGFFSVFNNDAVKEIELYKGDIPAAYGGRLSSLLKVEIAEGNPNQFHGRGGIGTISSRLTLEGPILDDKTTFMLAGRRSYTELYIPLFAKNNPDLEGAGLYFYDVNAKLKHKINSKNTLTWNYYKGWDEFYQERATFGFGNEASTLSWVHSYNENVATKVSALYSKYNYKTGASFDETSFDWRSEVRDVSIRIDNTVLLDESNTIKFGLTSTHHQFNPGKITASGSEALFSEYELNPNSALEWGLYGSNVQKIGDKLTLKYGLRFSIFQNVGPGTIYAFDESYNLLDSAGTVYKKGDVFNVNQGLEPRLGLVYMLNDFSSIKASYSRTIQYIQLASNSSGGMPLDIWFSTNNNVKPQLADQGAIGYFRNFLANQLEGSVELYYKNMQNTIDFRDHATLLFNQYLDGEFRIGRSWAYGAEFMLRFNMEKLNGWVSYTLSKTERNIPEINKGNTYVSPYDKPNDISIVLNYLLNKRVSLSATWVYATGNPMTAPSGRFEIDNVVLSVYSDRNAYRMPDYHRLDLGLTLYQKPKEGRRWHSEWNFSVYNAYARHNAWVINFVTDENNPNKTNAEMTYLFSLIPSVTYNFNF